MEERNINPNLSPIKNKDVIPAQAGVDRPLKLNYKVATKYIIYQNHWMGFAVLTNLHFVQDDGR